MEKKIDFNSELFQSLKGSKKGEDNKVDLVALAKKISDKRAEKIRKGK